MPKGKAYPKSAKKKTSKKAPMFGKAAKANPFGGKMPVGPPGKAKAPPFAKKKSSKKTGKKKR